MPKVNTNLDIKRGYLYYADLSPVVGSEQGGVRPVLIIQNDIGNKYSPTVIVAAITSQINKQIRTIDKKRLREKIGCLDKNMMLKVDNSLQISLGLFTL